MSTGSGIGIELPAADTAASKGSAPLAVTDILREAIAAGKISPGTKLPETALSEQLKVSRHTLRSAFQLLAAEGLVVAVPHRGVFVHQPTVDDVREIYLVRRILQTGLFRTTTLSKECLSTLEEIVRAAEASREQHDVAAMAQANQEFHQCLAVQANSPMVEELMAKILARMRLIFAAMRDQPDFHSEFVARNAQLVELLAAGENAAAEEYLLEYLHIAESDVLAHMSSEHAGM